jgi:hypothetical protein
MLSMSDRETFCCVVWILSSQLSIAHLLQTYRLSTDHPPYSPYSLNVFLLLYMYFQPHLTLEHHVQKSLARLSPTLSDLANVHMLYNSEQPG